MTTKAGIYRISRVGSLDCYVGQAVDLEQRWYLHRSTLSRGKHHSRYLQRAWKKYGAEAFEFEILELVPNVAGLMQMEQLWMDRLSPRYNTCKAGWSRLGIKHSEETKARIAATLTGRKKSKESIEKQIYTRKTNNKPRPPLSAEHKAKLTFAGRKHTKESIKKFSASKIGRPLSPEHRAAISATKRKAS